MGTPRTAQFDWTEERKATLRTFWDQQYTARAIAAKFGNGCTKNAVLGAAHRMNLPSRPNPAKRSQIGNPGAPQNRRWTDAKIITMREMWHTDIATSTIANAIQMRLTSVYAKAKEIGLPLQTWASNVKPKDAANRQASREPIRAPDSLNIPMGELRANGCRYPTSKNQPHTFCGAKAELGHPYCRAHESVCYIAGSALGANSAPVAPAESLSA